jgi:hypothetical protein
MVEPSQRPVQLVPADLSWVKVLEHDADQMSCMCGAVPAKCTLTLSTPKTNGLAGTCFLNFVWR